MLGTQKAPDMGAFAFRENRVKGLNYSALITRIC